jgi:hypothetical protein
MTRFWIRNFTSRKDSRTGACVWRRGAEGIDGGPPAGAGTFETGGPPAGASPELPGRALSIRFNRDMTYTPSRPEGRI